MTTERVARLTLPGGIHAELDDGGRWQSADASLARLLNLSYSPGRQPYAGPGAGAFGHAAARAAAAALGGRVELSAIPRLTSGNLY